MQHLVVLEGCTVSLGGKPVLENLDFRLSRGERWAVFGPNGSGKTTLLRLIRGELHPAQWANGKRRYDLGAPGGDSPVAARRNISLVSAESQDARARLGLDSTGQQVVLSGLSDSMYPPHRPTPDQRQAAATALDSLGVRHLAGKRLPAMSRGEARIILLARALAMRPKVLLLDEFLDGLDASAEKTVLERLQELADSGATMIMTSHRPHELPRFVDRAALMDHGRIVRTGTPQDVAAAFVAQGAPFDRRERPADRNAPEYLVRIRNATVRRDGRDVLEDVSLDIRPGEHWAVLGENGAGKTTLLMLIMAGIRPLSGGRVDWFGRGGPADVFEIRRRIGLVSPEMQADYAYDVDALEFVLSGFDSSIGLYREPEEHETRRALDLIGLAGLDGLQRSRIRSLSYGQLRRLLVARALVADPDLLLLDEAAAGLDPSARNGLLRTLENAAAAGTSLVYATHRQSDLPRCINRILTIHNRRAKVREVPSA